MPHVDDGTPHSDDLHELIGRQLDRLGHRDDPDVRRLVDELHRRHGNRVAAVLLYGSYLRGKRDTLLDFYVLLTDLRGALPGWQAWGNRWLPPNVYYLSLPAYAEGDALALRAKYATLSVAQFEDAMDNFHSYFWARFIQPTGLVEAHDQDVVQRVVTAMAAAMHKLAREMAPLFRDEFAAPAFWQQSLALTYRCELRSESPAGVASLYQHHARHFDALLAGYTAAPGAAISRVPGGRYGAVAHGRMRRAQLRWALRRIQGKWLSVLRLVKAAGTFDDPLDYLLWKIERHSGIYIAPSERQRRYPLIFAWGLLWRLYRRGAFR
jgi:hypothetical protein